MHGAFIRLHGLPFREAARWRTYIDEYHGQHVNWGRAPREFAQRNVSMPSP